MVSRAAPGVGSVPGWPVAFRGSTATRAGLVTPGQLRGPTCVRLFPDTYIRRAEDPPGLAVRSYAAHLYSGRRGILSGYSAAERLGAGCHPPDAPAELTVLRGDLRSRAGLLVHRDRMRPDEYEVDAGVPVTTRLRTAYDLGRRVSLIEAVVAVDAMARCGRFPPAAVHGLTGRYPGVRGCAQLPRVVELADARAESPMETAPLLVLRGLPVPEARYPVQDESRRRAVWLDLAYTKYEVYGEPDEIAARSAGRSPRDGEPALPSAWSNYRRAPLGGRLTSE